MTKYTSENLLIIMAKEPIPGQVKTRLSPELSFEDAANLSQCFFEDRIAEVSNIDSVDLAIAYSPDSAQNFFAALTSARFKLFPQIGDNLGQRMSALFIDQLSRGYKRVCIVGCDTPDLPSSIMVEAFDLLKKTADIVLGPSLDGGYYLIAVKESHPELFTDIKWGSPDVLKTTLERISGSWLSAALLEPWRDIDTFEDVCAYYKEYYSRQYSRKPPGTKTLSLLASKIFFHTSST